MTKLIQPQYVGMPNVILKLFLRTVKTHWLKQPGNWLSHTHFESEITNFLVVLTKLFLQSRKFRLKTTVYACFRPSERKLKKSIATDSP